MSIIYKSSIIWGIILFFLAVSAGFADEYPQLDIIGYKEYNLTQSRLGGNAELAKQEDLYKEFPTNLRNQAFKWEERLSLYIAGKLSEDLSVSYSLEQEPDFPDRFDIIVKYKTHQLTFGHFNAEFEGGDFISFNKAMDGFMADSKGDDYKVKVVTAKERSTAKKITITGNGNKEYSLGQRYILPGSVKVRLNNTHYPADYYSINNYDGTITFDRIMTSTDLIEIMFEYTNPIQDLIPTLGRVSFTGFEADYSVETPPDPVPVFVATADRFIIPPKVVKPVIPSIDYKYTIRPDFKLNITSTIPGGTITINAITPFLIRKVWLELTTTRTSTVVLGLLQRPKREDIQTRKPLYLMGTFPIPAAARPGTYNATFFFQTGLQTHRMPVTYQVLPSQNKPAADSNAIRPTEDIRAFVATLETQPPAEQQVFMLNNRPLVVGSEQVKLNGITLQKDFDYYLNYIEGKLQIVSYELKPSDNIDISYQYYQTRATTENVVGNGTVGPYLLKHTPIVRKSEAIYLDKRKLWRGLDYEIDYLSGELKLFTKVFPISNLVVTYKYQIMIIPEKLEERPEMYTVGVSYLEERSKTLSEETEEAIAAGTSTTNIAIDLRVIIDNDKIILPQAKIPINTDKEFILEINGATIVSGDYTLNDFQGIITITSANVLSSFSSLSDITVNYTALRSFDAQWRYTVDSQGLRYSDAQGVYIDSEDPNYRAEYLPVVYNSITVKLRGRGSADSFEELPTINYQISYLNEGEQFKIYFVTTNLNAQNLVTTASWTDMEDMEILVLYKYAPGSFADAGDVVQKVFGLRGKVNFGEDFYLQCEVAQSTKEMNRGIDNATDRRAGTGISGDKYNLSNANIVKDSEEVYIVNNSYPNGQLISNDKYSLNYRVGYIRFRSGLIPHTSDIVEVRYSYYTGSQAQQQLQVTSGNAVKIQSGAKMGALNATGYYSDVTSEFNPIGSIDQAKGTSEFGGNAVYQPSKHFQYTLDLKNNIPHKIDTDGKPYNENTLFHKHTLTFKPFNYGDMNLSHEQSQYSDDPHVKDSAAEIHEVEAKSYSQKMSYAFDLAKYPSLFEINRGGAANSLDKSDTFTNWLHFNNTYTPFSQFKIITDYQQSQEGSMAQASIPEEVLLNMKTTTITKFNIGYTPISEINTQTDYSYQRVYNQNDVTVNVTSHNLQEIKDWAFDYKYTPGWVDSFFYKLDMHGRIYHNENQVAFSGYAPDTEDKQSFDTRWAPWSIVNMTYDNQANTNLNSNDQDRRFNRANQLRFSGFNLLSLISLKELNINHRFSERDNLTETTSSRNYTNSTEDDFNYSLSSPQILFLNADYYYQEKENNDLSKIEQQSVIEDKLINHPYNKYIWDFKFSPPTFYIPFTWLSLGTFNGLSSVTYINDIINETTISNNALVTSNSKLIITDSQNWAGSYSVNLLPNISLKDDYNRSQAFIQDTTSVSTANRSKDEYIQNNTVLVTWSRPLPFINITSVSGGADHGDIFRLEFEKLLSVYIYTRKHSASATYQPLSMITITGGMSRLEETKYESVSANFMRNSELLQKIHYDTWFNRDTLVWRNYATIAQKNMLDDDYTTPNIYELLGKEAFTVSIFFQPHRGTTKFFENALSAAPVYTFGWYYYLDRLTLYRFGEMMDLARSKWKKFPTLTYAYLLAPDFMGYAHGVNSQQYSRAIRHTDQHIGRILGDLETAGLLDKIVIALVSDHSMGNVKKHFHLEKYLRNELFLNVARKHLWENTSQKSRR
ncbi:MAG: alkaline phosphatase family protein, partial [Candidatus Margulisiibacteriota bacterium]